MSRERISAQVTDSRASARRAGRPAGAILAAEPGAAGTRSATAAGIGPPGSSSGAAGLRAASSPPGALRAKPAFASGGGPPTDPTGPTGPTGPTDPLEFGHAAATPVDADRDAMAMDQVSDHLGQLLLHADALLAEWSSFGARVQAQVAHAAGSLGHTVAQAVATR